MTIVTPPSRPLRMVRRAFDNVADNKNKSKCLSVPEKSKFKMTSNEIE
jgi:hypothetical protein